MKKYSDEYLRVRPYFSEDFYPLTEVSDKLDTWCGWQFHNAEKNEGIVQIFRREESPYECASFALRGLIPEDTYIFTDADGGEFEVTGDELLSGNLKIAISEKRKAKLYFYNPKSKAKDI